MPVRSTPKGTPWSSSQTSADHAGARAAFAEFVGIARGLASSVGTPESLRHLSASLNRIGDVDRDQGDRARARAAFEESLGIARDLVTRVGTHESLRDLCVSLDKVGHLALEEGNLEDARAAFDESLPIRRDLASRLGTRSARRGWVWSAQRCASAMIQGSDFGIARSTLEQSRAAVDAISELSDIEMLDTAAAWWDRWREVHEVLGDQSIVKDARARADSLRKRIKAMKAASARNEPRDSST